MKPDYSSLCCSPVQEAVVTPKLQQGLSGGSVLCKDNSGAGRSHNPPPPLVVLSRQSMTAGQRLNVEKQRNECSCGQVPFIHRERKHFHMRTAHSNRATWPGDAKSHGPGMVVGGKKHLSHHLSCLVLPRQYVHLGHPTLPPCKGPCWTFQLG